MIKTNKMFKINTKNVLIGFQYETLSNKSVIR